VERDSEATRAGLTRRTVLASAGALAALGGCRVGTQLFLIGSHPTADSNHPEWVGSRVRRHRPLGRTGFRMSDISFGCADLRDPEVVRLAIDRGINYFDTSPDYSDAASERALGQGIRGTRRERVFVASKFCTPGGHLASDTPVGRVIEAVEASLHRLGTDHLDLVLIHAVNSVERLMAPNLHEAFDRLKESGKVRFLGVSSHTPDLETVMRHAVGSGRFDAIMVAYNFRHWPELTEIFAEAQRRGVGVVAMKTLKGAYHTSLRDFTPTERESFAQAAFKWVLSNRDVDGLACLRRRGHRGGRGVAGEVRPPGGAALLPARLRRVPRPVSPAGAGARRAALRDVRRELWARRGRGEPLRAPRPGAQRRGMRRLRRALRRCLRLRASDPGE
jgi:aryl-alcohol dehydrogenase-like predicted oxidoreductase